MEIEAHEIIMMQKNVISDLQHDNILLQLQIKKLQKELNQHKENKV
jgi:hypothetical protein